MSITEFDKIILSTYGFSINGVDSTLLSDTVTQLKQHKKLTPIIESVYQSDRHPYSIMLLASKIGMYIPPLYRSGYKTYEFFIHNVGYYEATFHRHGRMYPTNEDLFLTNSNRLSYLMQFRDDEILKVGVKWDSNYSDRKDMIQKFIESNIIHRGEFTLESNATHCYRPDNRVIFYSDSSVHLAFNVDELGKAIDVTRKVIYKSETEVFDRMTILQLRRRILEKFGQWKDRTGQPVTPHSLLSLVYKFDEIIPNDTHITNYVTTS